MDQKPTAARAPIWFVICSVVAILHLARDFLLPIAVAVFLAFILAPLVDRLTSWHLPRLIATAMTMLAVALCLGLVGWIFASQFSDFTEKLPEYRDNLRVKITAVKVTVDDWVSRANHTVRDLSGASDLPNQPTAGSPPARAEGGWWSLAQSTLRSMADGSAILAIVLLLAFIILLRWEDLRDRVLALAGASDLHVTTRASQEAARSVSIYLRRQMLVNTLHGTAMGLILWSIGVPNPLIWGILGAALRFVPYLGPIAATLAPVLVSLAAADGWSPTVAALAALVTLEVFTNNVLEPLAYGSGTGISPFALLVSATFWTWIWGPIGLALSTPLTLCLLVVGRYLPSLRFIDILFSDAPAMSPDARFYQRLLADDVDEAWQIVEREMRATSFAEACDRVILPALSTTGLALADGRIDGHSRDQVVRLADTVVDELIESVPAANGGTVVARCLGARDGLDAVAARLLALELTRQGVDAPAVPCSRLLAETLAEIKQAEVSVVCLSSVLPTHFLHVRSICKRLLATSETVEVVVALWGEQTAANDLLQRLPASPRLRVVTGFADAVAAARESVSRQGASRASRPLAIPAIG